MTWGNFSKKVKTMFLIFKQNHFSLRMNEGKITIEVNVCILTFPYV
jgi:hypothetical protein